jgi:hypothetical protein
MAYDDRRSERKPYSRLRAPVYFNRSHRPFWRKRRETGAELGSFRIYSDDPAPQGAVVELEVFLPDGASVTCKAEVAWIEALPPDGPARYDIGLDLIAIHPHDWERIVGVLEPAPT